LTEISPVAAGGALMYGADQTLIHQRVSGPYPASDSCNSSAKDNPVSSDIAAIRLDNFAILEYPKVSCAFAMKAK
jgi:hypothetical protein